MEQLNTKGYAIEFCDMLQKLMEGFKYVGDWSWGNPAGQAEEIPVYEIVTKEGKRTWCSIIEYGNSRTGEPNRRGILATFPVEKKQSLGSIMATMIPYSYTRTVNTRAFVDDTVVEIRDYGKHTVGRAGIKKEDFFNYMEQKYPDKVLLDEEGQKYVNVYRFEGELTAEDFARQTYEMTSILADYKQAFR